MRRQNVEVGVTVVGKVLLVSLGVKVLAKTETEAHCSCRRKSNITMTNVVIAENVAESLATADMARLRALAKQILIMQKCGMGRGNSQAHSPNQSKVPICAVKTLLKFRRLQPDYFAR